jgi:hypothetical protein
MSPHTLSCLSFSLLVHCYDPSLHSLSSGAQSFCRLLLFLCAGIHRLGHNLHRLVLSQSREGSFIFSFPTLSHHAQVARQICSIYSRSSWKSGNELSGLLVQIQDLIESFLETDWTNSEKIYLNLFPQMNVAIDGLVNHLSGSRQLFAYFCRRFVQGGAWIASLKQLFPESVCHSIQQLFETIYLQYLGPYLTPTSTLDRGDLRFYFIRPTHLNLPTGCGLTPQEVVNDLHHLYGLPSSTGHQLHHLILITSSPRDLMKQLSRWQEDDSPTSLPDEKTRAEPRDEPKLRGKHELIHGAYTTNPSSSTFSVPATDLTGNAHRNDVRKGGDRDFNSLIRMLFKWISLSPPGHRRVSLISTNWINGMDFALSLDGQSEHIIAHHSLEATVEDESQLSSDDQDLLQRIRLSFNDRVKLESSPQSHASRSMVVMTSPGIGLQSSSIEFLSHVQDVSSTIATPSPTSSTLLSITDSSITRLTHDCVTIDINLKGRGVLDLNLYEVPLMATTDEVFRLIETESPQMSPTRHSVHDIISESSLSLTFEGLTSYCSYAIYFHPSPTATSSSCPPPSATTAVKISAQELIHFRTFVHEERHAATFLLAAVSEEECTTFSGSEVFTRLVKELDCSTRPTAAPLHFIHTDIRLLPNTIFHSRPSHLSRPKELSSEFKCLRRKTHLTMSGFFDDYWTRDPHPSFVPLPPHLPLPPPQFYCDELRNKEYETQNGGVEVSYSNETCRFSLQLNTHKSLLCLLDHVSMVMELDTLKNIQIFSSKPLIPYSENRDHNPPLPEEQSLEDGTSLLWEKSKHFTDPKYLSLVTQLVGRLLQWKEKSPRRDCQIFSMAHTPEVLLSYFHRLHESYFHGFRHITLPISLGLTVTEEKILFPLSGPCPLSSFCVTSFQYTHGGSHPPSALPSSSPFHLIPPLYAFHGTKDTSQRFLTRPIYRVTVFTDNLLDHDDDVHDRVKIVGRHHDLVVKQIVHDIDSLEVTLGPIVGNVTYTSCGILFEMNRRVDRLRCLLKPVESPDKGVELILPADPSLCMKYEFQGLESGAVYEIFLPEIHGTLTLGKFRTLSTKSMYSEVLFLGEESLEYFPVTQRILSDLNHQQALSFRLIGLESSLKSKLQQTVSQKSHELPYRRPWNAVRSKMKELSCSTSVVIHIGSHALLCRIFSEIIPPLIAIVKKYRLDDEQHLRTSALSALYHLQLTQVIEDTLRAIWIMEPAVKEVFQNSANIPLYNTEYWLSEHSLLPPAAIGSRSQSNESSRDYLAFNIIRRLYEAGLQKYLYTLRGWNSRSYHHFFQWREGSMAIAALDFASEQMELINRHKLKQIESSSMRESGASGSASGSIEGEDEMNSEEGRELSDGSEDGLGDLKATTFSADFMSENQWKHLRQMLVDKSIHQIVICSQYPLIPLEMTHPDDGHDHNDGNELTASPTSRPPKVKKWTPSETNILKLFEQFFKWLNPKKASTDQQLASRNLTIVCTSDYSFVTNIQDLKSGMKIQQVCLGKFSCHSQAHQGLNSDTSTYQLAGKLGGMRFIHRVCGLDVVVLDSSRSGNGGRYSGSMTPWHQPGDAVYGLMRYWFDSWKAIGTCNFYPIHPTGPPESPVGEEAVLLVGPIIGAPYLRSSGDGGSKMMVPILLEVDRDVQMTMIATELFSGKQMTLSLKLVRMKPTLIRIGPLHLDSRYTMEFIEGIQNSHAFKFVLQTTHNWTDTNIVLLNAAPQVDPSKNSSEFVRDIIRRFQIPFHGMTAVVHTDVEVDVTAILDEAQTQPELEQMLRDALKPTPDTAILHRLREYVAKVMDRIRAEYRMYLTRPSYRELLLRAFNLFMPRDDEDLTFFEDDELFFTQHGSSGSLLSLLKLISSRVRQEYFDQFLVQEDRLYAVWPRIRRTKEMIHDENLKKQLQRDSGVVMRGGGGGAIMRKMMILTIENCEDEEILKYPRPRQPDRRYSDPTLDPVDCVLNQWMRDLIPSPPLWVPWLSPNRKVSIERLCSDSDDNIKEFHERIFNNDAPMASSRILVLPSIGNLFDSENRVGYKLQEWIRAWVGNDPNRSISLFCPARQNEGTYLYAIDYFLRASSPNPSSSSSSSSPPQLIIQLLHSIYSSNEKEIQKTKTEKVAEMKKKLSSKGGVSGRRAVAKRKEEEEKLKLEIQEEMNQIFSQLTPDGYVIYESKSLQDERDKSLMVVSTNLRSISSELQSIESRPSFFDYLSLPSWFMKFCPCTPGVFVQDEVILVLRQDPHYREFLSLLEEDNTLFQAYRKAYESSRLSELSRPLDLREVDMTVPGIVEVFLENIIEKIWSEVLPPLLKGKLFTMTDDFVRSYCLARAFSDLQTSLTSSHSFAKSMRMMVFSCALLFLACKMATGPESSRWESILRSPEFVEDQDEELKISSDDEENDDDEEEEESVDRDGGDGDDEVEQQKEGGEGGGKGKKRSNDGEQIVQETSLSGGATVEVSRDERILQVQKELWDITQKRIERRQRYGAAMNYMNPSQFI